jgi:hypothetical protein
MIYKTPHDIRTNNDLQNTTWHRDKQCPTKHYMTEGQTMIYKILHDIVTKNDLKVLHDIVTNNSLQNYTWQMD